MDAGKLVDDELIIKLVTKRINVDDCKNGYLFDGFPRTIPQAQSLRLANIQIDLILNIIVDEADIVNRITGEEFILPVVELTTLSTILQKYPKRMM